MDEKGINSSGRGSTTVEASAWITQVLYRFKGTRRYWQLIAVIDTLQPIKNGRLRLQRVDVRHGNVGRRRAHTVSSSPVTGGNRSCPLRRAPVSALKNVLLNKSSNGNRILNNSGLNVKKRLDQRNSL
jgi:hypothetical protein